MTKRDFVVRIASELNLSQNQVAGVIQKTLDYISDEIAEGSTLELRNFGIFQIKVRKSRPGRNPKKPEDKVIIPKRAWLNSGLAKNSTTVSLG